MIIPEPVSSLGTHTVHEMPAFNESIELYECSDVRQPLRGLNPNSLPTQCAPSDIPKKSTPQKPNLKKPTTTVSKKKKKRPPQKRLDGRNNPSNREHWSWAFVKLIGVLGSGRNKGDLYLEADFKYGSNEVSKRDFEAFSPEPVDWSATGLKLSHLVGKKAQFSWYHTGGPIQGMFSRMNEDGTFDVQYDDGDSDRNLDLVNLNTREDLYVSTLGTYEHGLFEWSVY